VTTASPNDAPSRRGIELETLSPEELWALSSGAVQQGDFETASNILGALLKKQPRNVEALRRLAATLNRLGDLRRPATLLRRAIGVAPRDATLHRDLGGILGNMADYDGARRALERSLKLNEHDEATWVSLLQIHERQRRWKDVRRACERALQLNPRSGQAMNHLARVARIEKNLEEAERWARRAAEESDDVMPRVDAWHLLGAIYEKQKRWDDAFDAHTRANRAKLTLPKTKLQLRNPIGLGIDDHVREGAEAYYRRWAERTFDDGLRDPVFLVGFPRSGTTMTEQVLGALDNVVTTDEHAFTAPVNAKIQSQFGITNESAATLDQLDSLTDEQVSMLRKTYWHDVRRICGEQQVKGKLVVDKYPLRYQEVGLLNLLFPHARIVFVVRDPRDCCLSGYFQHFATNRGMVRFLTLETAGQMYADTVSFWLKIRELTTMPYLEIRYEDLVSDFEPNARRLVEFIGRPWTDAVLEFHTKAGSRAISTPSAEAVTERVNTRAIGKWANYERHLGPLVERVHPFLEVWGYEE
jgi:tetratricopeptide (TPR) repeat protein